MSVVSKSRSDSLIVVDLLFFNWVKERKRRGRRERKKKVRPIG